jgi:hypothetical protein
MKHKLDRKSLEKLYIGFIRPILEYGGIVWDNCSSKQGRYKQMSCKGLPL